MVKIRETIHSTSTALKITGKMFVSSQLIQISKLPKRQLYYIVKELQFDDFLNFKKFSGDLKILSTRKGNTTENIDC